MPLQSIPLSIDALKNINNDVYVICLSGKRSEVAVKIFQSNNIKAKNVIGGMLAWNKLSN